jgi:hypothetical protein
MAHSGSRSGQRTEVAPPRDPASRAKRNGYVLLAASGVVLATAFGGIAQLASSSSSASDLKGGNSNSASGPQLIPGSAVPGTMTVSGVAQPDPSTSPTAVVSVGPDGTTVVTILPAPGSDAKPIVLAPGAPIPAGTYIPPGTTIPSTNPTSPPRDDSTTTTTKPAPTTTTTTPEPTTTTTVAPPSSATTTTAAADSSSTAG